MLYRTEKHVIYDNVACPRCGHVGCESYNGSNPTNWHCPRCNEIWNPDNTHLRPTIEVGSDITVGDLRVGDVVVYSMTQGTGKRVPFQREETVTVPHGGFYMNMSVVNIDDDGIMLQRPYIHVDATATGRVGGRTRSCSSAGTVAAKFSGTCPILSNR